MSIFSWGVQSLVSAKPEEPKPERYNPRPPGVICEDSATAFILNFLRENPHRYFPAGVIVKATGRSEKAVSWGLLYLRSLGRIEAVANDLRNSRYLLYRHIVPDQSSDGSEI